LKPLVLVIAEPTTILYGLTMPTLTQHRFSVREYYRMGELGFLPPDARVELLNGQIIDMSPIGPTHGGVVTRLIRLLGPLSHGRWQLTVQNPIHLDDYSEPQPDLTLLKPRADDYVRSHAVPEDIFLLIEVSDSTLETDREVKIPAYGRASIAEVWIVNLVNSTLEIYREPNFTGYGAAKVLQAGDKASPGSFPDAIIDVGELLMR
jgi:Uma2 family endonuclease